MLGVQLIPLQLYYQVKFLIKVCMILITDQYNNEIIERNVKLLTTSLVLYFLDEEVSSACHVINLISTCFCTKP